MPQVVLYYIHRYSTANRYTMDHDDHTSYFATLRDQWDLQTICDLNQQADVSLQAYGAVKAAAIIDYMRVDV